MKDIAPEYDSVELQSAIRRMKNFKALNSLCRLSAAGNKPVDSRLDFESQEFPPQGWELNPLPGNVCRPDETAANKGWRGLLFRTLEPVPRMEI